MVHELGHLFHEQVPFAFPRLWLSELFANYCLHAYLVAVEPDQLPVWTAVTGLAGAVPPDHLAHRSLADFERLYIDVGAENYVWYQFRFVAAPRALDEAAGVAALPRLYHTFATNQDDLSEAQLTAILAERVHPRLAQEIRAWPA